MIRNSARSNCACDSVSQRYIGIFLSVMYNKVEWLLYNICIFRAFDKQSHKNFSNKLGQFIFFFRINIRKMNLGQFIG